MRQLVLMRGLPGSGKSTRARAIAIRHLSNKGTSMAILSTDDYHMVDGEYIFNAEMLGQFHELNHKRAERFMRCETELVIIDNTNVRHRDMKSYKDSAEQLGYDVLEVIVGRDELFPGMEDACQYKLADYIDVCTERNTHGVPRGAIEKMARRFQE